MSDNSTETNSLTENGQVLLNKVFKIAPLSSSSAEELIPQGWEEFYSFRDTLTNGAPNTPDLLKALAAIQSEVPLSLKTDWDICMAKSDKYKNDPIEYERIKILLKREHRSA